MTKDVWLLMQVYAIFHGKYLKDEASSSKIHFNLETPYSESKDIFRKHIYSQYYPAISKSLFDTLHQLGRIIAVAKTFVSKCDIAYPIKIEFKI